MTAKHFFLLRFTCSFDFLVEIDVSVTHINEREVEITVSATPF